MAKVNKFEDLEKFNETLALAKNGDVNAQNDLYEYFLPTINIIAGSIARKGVSSFYSHDDLVQDGSIGLMDAIKKSEDDSNLFSFSSYARTRIKGEMIDALRRYGLLYRQDVIASNQYKESQRKLEQELGRKPRESEIKQTLSDAIQKSFEYVRLVSQDGLITSNNITNSEGNSQSVFDLMSNDDDLEDLYSKKEILELIKEYIFGDSKLLKQNQKIVLIDCFKGLSLLEIAEKIGLTESRVCQLKFEAIEILKEKFK